MHPKLHSIEIRRKIGSPRAGACPWLSRRHPDGMANLVPGVSGARCSAAPASTRHFVRSCRRAIPIRLGPIVMLSIIAFGALVMILPGAGVLRICRSPLDHVQPVLGFTLGGVPCSGPRPDRWMHDRCGMPRGNRHGGLPCWKASPTGRPPTRATRCCS